MEKVNITRENGMQIKEVVGVACTLVMEQFMKENGTMMKEMDKEWLD